MNAPKNPQTSYSQTTLSPKPRPFYRRSRFWKILIVALIILLLVRHCVAKHKKHAATGLPVVLGIAKTANVPVYLTGLGAVTPTYTVTVRTQINGQLLEVNFKEGQLVKKGDLLAQIDPRPYEALLIQYQGQLVRDQALLANAKLDLVRYQTLWKQDSVAQQTFDTQKSLVEQNEGTVKIDQGLIQSTELSLLYCRITSPVDGRVGLRLVDPGNYVQTSDTSGLAVLDTVSPITVIFTLPEDSIPSVQEEVNAGQVLTVEAYDRAQTRLLATGTLLTMDNQIDPTTGTVKLRSQFANENKNLFPNQFVNVKLLIKTLQNAVVVPTQAIQHGAKGTYIYVITPAKKSDSDARDKDKAELTVNVKEVVVGVTNDDESTVNTGIAPGDQVVIEGADKLTDGAKVYIAQETAEEKVDEASSETNSTRRRFA